VYVWSSTPQLVADAQDWLNQPATNFGWCLKTNEQEASAKRFDSREHPEPTLRPQLTVEFTFLCLGDFDGSGVVDLGDLTILLAHYGMTEGATPDQGDIDADGNVDLSDLSLLLSLYGTVCR